jgi:type I restriction enzyme S subunit
MKSKLSAICHYVNGKISVSELDNSTYISTENMLPNKGGVTVAATLPTVSQAQIFEQDDVLVSNIRPYFKKIWLANQDGGCSNDVLVFRANEGVEPGFLYYVLSDNKFFNYSMATSKGTKMPRGDKKALMEYEVPDFDVGTQRKMACLLGNIDDKIEVNNEINKNLEQQASLLFKSWFVDFDPFDEALSNTPFGNLVPASLKMRQIADIPHTLETGRRPKGGAVSEGIPSIGAENVKELGTVNLSSAKYIPNDFASKMKTGAVKGYELMLYKDGGKPGTFIPHFSMFGEGFPYDKFFINEHVFKLDFYDHGYNEFAYFYMQTDYPYNWLANNGGKAAIPGINQQDVNSIWIFTLDNPLVQKFCDWVQPLFKTIFTNCTQNMKLANLRDSLLPKLISGELDVSDLDL